MKKTFTINISGIIFHIDDDAYSKLNAYLASIKAHFKNLDGSDEIIADIENRIAEILQSKLTDTKQVISITDINEVISRMGQPSEFTEEMEDEEGIPYTRSGYKRLYRNGDDRVIGGVASGIGAYLKADPIWIRLAFIVSIFTALGIPIYLILWIALPEARTTSERLEMRGKNITISNIEKSISDEFHQIKDRLSNLSEPSSQKAPKTERPPTPNIFDDLLSAFKKILRFIGRGFVILIGIVFLILGFSFVIGILAGFFGFSELNDHVSVVSFSGFYDLMFHSVGGRGLFGVGILLFIGIPILMLIYHGIRFIFGFDRIKSFGSYAFIFWLMGLVFTAVFAFKVVKNFINEEDINKEIAVVTPSTNTIYLKGTNPTKQLSKIKFLEFDRFEACITDKSYYINEIHIHLRPSNDETYSLTENIYSMGRTRYEASWKAEQIEYNVTQNDSVFTFDQFFKMDKELGFTGQNIDIFLRVPIGTKIKLDRNITEKLGSYYRHRYNDSNKTYMMTKDGLRPEEN